MSTRHRNAGGPFVIFDPGLGISGSLSVHGGIAGTNEGLQIQSATNITGSLFVERASGAGVVWALHTKRGAGSHSAYQIKLEKIM